MEQIRLAVECNMNIYRCWGGSGIQKADFYELCDIYGMMVWVEFPLACNNYVGTEKYLRILEQEATAIIKKLRSRACHVLWCGGNELFNNVFCNIFAHIVVDASACKDNLAVIAELLCFICKIIRVNADAVTADKTGEEFEEIPFCACCFKHRFCVDTHFVEDD